MKLHELKTAAPTTMKSSGTDDPKKYVGGWETYDEPQGIGDRQDKKVLAKESDEMLFYHDHTELTADIIQKVEETFKNTGRVEIELGFSSQSPSAYVTAIFMEEDVDGDFVDTIGGVKIRYSDHPDRHGSDYTIYYTPYVIDDEDGNGYYGSNISSTDMKGLVKQGIDIINREYQESLVESVSFAPLDHFGPEDDIPLQNGPVEDQAIKLSRKAPKKHVRASVKALSARGKPANLNPHRVMEIIRRPFTGTLTNDYEIVDDNDKSIGFAKVVDGIINNLEYDTEADQNYRGHILSAMMSQIVNEADRNSANLSIQVVGMTTEIVSLLERFGFRGIGGNIMKRGYGSVRPQGVNPPQGMVNRID